MGSLEADSEMEVRGCHVFQGLFLGWTQWQEGKEAEVVRGRSHAGKQAHSLSQHMCISWLDHHNKRKTGGLMQ